MYLQEIIKREYMDSDIVLVHRYLCVFKGKY